MGRYLDPKNNTLFRSIFGKHPELLISFLNAMMPLEENQYIKTVEYIQDPTGFGDDEELIEVLCRDNRRKKFIVEMDIEPGALDRDRMLYILSNAYVRQDKMGIIKPSPVYGVAITNDISVEDIPEYYHHFALMRRKAGIRTPGMDIVVIELPRFDATNTTEEKMRTLWLRFLKEINENCDIEPAPELLENEYIRKAIELCKIEDK
ncbi:MAG: Rpn family recombination-promoting nuclease/putative transposase [Prevotellaceae bacterium]|jgi:hypothetical protein|nr:Rpn family recombination-promoting nuclease/putative transposase [Prevotellaceae bacterium]